MALILGVDRFLRDASLRKLVNGKRVGVLAHPASMSYSKQRHGHWQHSLDAIIELAKESGEFKVTAAFGPQHGMRGEKQDNMQETEDYVDQLWKIPVYSLYGEVRRPTKKMLENVDVVLIDLQDVGTRIYTFLTTLLYVIEECAKSGKSVVVLDRPNPAGRPVEGSLLKKGFISFVGAAEGIPMRHGMTLGEMGSWMVTTLNIDVNYSVIPMLGYDPRNSPGFGWPVQELEWVNPSPNAATVSMARAFPGTVLLEGTVLSEGRGTTRPLEMMGGAGFDMNESLRWMQSNAPEWLKGCLLRPTWFLPTFQKFQGQIIPGIQIHCDSTYYQHEEFKPYRLVSLWLKSLKAQNPGFQIWRDFHYEYEKDRLAIDLINGNSKLREWVDSPTVSIDEFEQALKRDEAAWIEVRRQFLLYPV